MVTKQEIYAALKQYTIAQLCTLLRQDPEFDLWEHGAALAAEQAGAVCSNNPEQGER